MLPDQLPWWVAGPGLGACVVAMYATANRKLGVSGGWLQVVFAGTGRPVTEPWRLWFNGGLIVGAVGGAVAGAGRAATHYGALGAALPAPARVVVLLAVGVMIGFGARWAGGCTSGHGLSGCAVGSPDSLLATTVFFAVAVASSFLVHWVSGGAI